MQQNVQGTALSTGNTVFTYEQTSITFSKGDNLMVNATQMAKAFGKLPTDWLRLKQTEELIDCVSVNMGIPIFDLVKVVQGAPTNGGGTWLHEDLALVFAQWLSPQFYLWCNRKIKELLTTGQTSLKELTPAEVLLKQVQMMVEQERRVASIEKRMNTLEAQTSTTPDFYTVVGYASLHGVRLNIKECSRIGRKASKVCQSIGVVPGDVPDPRFGRVNTYPSCVLDDIFNEPITT